jgi:hypothetical protein
VVILLLLVLVLVLALALLLHMWEGGVNDMREDNYGRTPQWTTKSLY